MNQGNRVQDGQDQAAQIMAAVVRACANGANFHDIVTAINRLHGPARRRWRLRIALVGDPAAVVRAGVEIDLSLYDTADASKGITARAVQFVPEAFSQVFSALVQTFIDEELVS